MPRRRGRAHLTRDGGTDANVVGLRVQILQLPKLERIRFNEHAFPLLLLLTVVIVAIVTKEQTESVAEVPAIPSAHINAGPDGSVIGMGQELEDSSNDAVFAVLARVARGVADQAGAHSCALRSAAAYCWLHCFCYCVASSIAMVLEGHDDVKM